MEILGTELRTFIISHIVMVCTAIQDEFHSSTLRMSELTPKFLRDPKINSLEGMRLDLRAT